MNPKIVILGTGPCGLGAAWRLEELKHSNYKVFEAGSHPGGLASSFTDEKGFTWDIGGHVQFSHYPYFDRFVDGILGKDCLWHERSSWVWIEGGYVPYPFQNNIRYLPKKAMWKCLSELIELYKKPAPPPRNFKDWILAVFGKGIAEVFMLPYNFKVWAYPPERLAYHWIGDRVSIVDVKRVTENILFEKDDISWGPNNKFRFPLYGGTGEIWRRCYAKLDAGKISFNHELVKLDTMKKTLHFKNGHRETYDVFINTMPLDKLISISDLPDKSSIQKLIHSSTHVVGIGLKGRTPDALKTKCWMYYPESDNPFYRVTVFSNYSPNNVPDIEQTWSLMAEVSESPEKPVDHSRVVDDVIQGMINTRLIRSRDEIVDIWHRFEPYGYPTPTLERDEGLKILDELDQLKVFSRGRFGSWKYEVSNQDHTFMQGVEAANRAVLGEEELTVPHPDRANDMSRHTAKR